MTTNSTKVFIQVESEEVQQENLKNSRRMFKVLQKTATDKENLAGRHITNSGKDFTAKLKHDIESTDTTDKKRKKIVISQHSQTDSEESCDVQITESDLTSLEGPSERYWEILAEKRRVALDESLKENEKLYSRIQSLEEELNISREMLKEANNLVEVLTEMLSESEENTEKTNEVEDETKPEEKDQND